MESGASRRRQNDLMNIEFASVFSFRVVDQTLTHQHNLTNKDFYDPRRTIHTRTSAASGVDRDGTNNRCAHGVASPRIADEMARKSSISSLQADSSSAGTGPRRGGYCSVKSGNRQAADTHEVKLKDSGLIINTPN
jgi:hypothetical protein